MFEVCFVCVFIFVTRLRKEQSVTNAVEYSPVSEISSC